MEDCIGAAVSTRGYGVTEDGIGDGDGSSGYGNGGKEGGKEIGLISDGRWDHEDGEASGVDGSGLVIAGEGAGR